MLQDTTTKFKFHPRNICYARFGTKPPNLNFTHAIFVTLGLGPNHQILKTTNISGYTVILKYHSYHKTAPEKSFAVYIVTSVQHKHCGCLPEGCIGMQLYVLLSLPGLTHAHSILKAFL